MSGKKSQAKGRRAANWSFAVYSKPRGYRQSLGGRFLSAALKQAAADAEKFGDGLPAVFHRGNRQSWRVTMELEDWLKLYMIYANGKG